MPRKVPCEDVGPGAPLAMPKVLKVGLQCRLSRIKCNWPDGDGLECSRCLKNPELRCSGPAKKTYVRLISLFDREDRKWEGVESLTCAPRRQPPAMSTMHQGALRPPRPSFPWEYAAPLMTSPQGKTKCNWTDGELKPCARCADRRRSCSGPFGAGSMQARSKSVTLLAAQRLLDGLTIASRSSSSSSSGEGRIYVPKVVETTTLQLFDREPKMDHTSMYILIEPGREGQLAEEGRLQLDRLEVTCLSDALKLDRAAPSKQIVEVKTSPFVCRDFSLTEGFQLTRLVYVYTGFKLSTHAVRLAVLLPVMRHLLTTLLCRSYSVRTPHTFLLSAISPSTHRRWP